MSNKEISFTKFRILLGPSKTLSAKSSEVKEFDEDLKSLFEDMCFTLADSEGIGLAAPQIGTSKALFVITKDSVINKVYNYSLGRAIEPSDFMVVINPKIIKRSKKTVLNNESCLSFPDIFVEVERSDSIVVTYQDINGKLIKKNLKGLSSICFQHEKDHLDGITLIDKIKDKKERLEVEKELQLRRLSLISSNPKIYQ